jgi:ornithine cyclodeaminase/alanine dehydrogenase-like protein (mu-crystallin family)
MLYLSEQDVLTLLTIPAAIDLVDGAFRMLADGAAINHPRRRIVMPNGATLAYMAAATPRYFGTKVYSVHPKGGMHFQVLIFRTEDAMPLATIEANHMGQIRTGAASGVATKYMARADAGVMAVIGSGFQAETQIAAVAAVRKLTEVRVWSRNAARREAFATRCSEKLGLNIRAAASAQEAVEGALVIATATFAKNPVIEREWVSPGAHINAIGANRLSNRELPTSLVYESGAFVTVDSIEDSKDESGDLMIPLSERQDLRFNAVEMHEVVSGRLPGRTSDDQITIFKSNGIAAEDVVSGGYVFEQATARGMGRTYS